MIQRCLTLLRDWAQFAEQDWHELPDRPGQGCYGTGYNNWGVQTNQKYLAAMAVLAAREQASDSAEVDRARRRALAALRFSLDSHVSGTGACTDGTRWGHTWISALGIERMMHGVHQLKSHLTDADCAALRRVLVSEADWLLSDYTKGGHGGPTGALWNSTGRNEPESNIWNGALLWRTAVMYPDEPRAAEWQRRAHHFLLNGVSIPADAEDNALIAGQPVRQWHAGPNFFPHYALDHHGYLNVGYMVICMSNAAMLYFDLKQQGLAIPESLHHHQADLWQVLRRMIFADGRLARIGGDTRIRYAYCQDYLLPALLYAADHLGDAHALELVAGQLEWIERESAASRDGGFYTRRLADSLARQSPYYLTRLESDRANALGMVIAYGTLTGLAERAAPAHGEQRSGGGHPRTAEQRAAAAFESSVAGGWCEPEHGAALHRSAMRFASFSWRASGLAQGLCQPPDDGHLAEWWQNLAGVVRFMGDDGVYSGSQSPHRKLEHYTIESFDGGFVTCGRVLEGVDLVVAEGWRRQAPMATHHLAFAALPDGRTVIGLQRVRMDNLRGYTLELKGMHLNIPNDLFNDYQRRLATEAGEWLLTSPVGREQVIDLQSRWAAIDDRLGAVALYGQPTLSLHRAPHRRGGQFRSLYVDELCLGCWTGPIAHAAGATLLDIGWAVLSAADAEATAQFAAAHSAARIDDLPAEVRGVRIAGIDGRTYAVLANFGDATATVSIDGRTISLQADQAMVL